MRGKVGREGIGIGKGKEREGKGNALVERERKRGRKRREEDGGEIDTLDDVYGARDSLGLGILNAVLDVMVGELDY